MCIVVAIPVGKLSPVLPVVTASTMVSLFTEHVVCHLAVEQGLQFQRVWKEELQGKESHHVLVVSFHYMVPHLLNCPGNPGVAQSFWDVFHPSSTLNSADTEINGWCTQSQN